MVIDMDNGCTVSFDGDQGGTYYVPCNVVKFLSDKDLSSSCSETIYLFRDLSLEHFKISCSSYSLPSYEDSNHTFHSISNVSNIRFNAMSNVYRNLDYVYLFVAFIVSVYCLFKMLRGFVR